MSESFTKFSTVTTGTTAGVGVGAGGPKGSGGGGSGGAASASAEMFALDDPGAAGGTATGSGGDGSGWGGWGGVDGGFDVGPEPTVPVTALHHGMRKHTLAACALDPELAREVSVGRMPGMPARTTLGCFPTPGRRETTPGCPTSSLVDGPGSLWLAGTHRR
jgi:hypothetical protein